MITVPVDDEQGEHHEGERQQSAHDNQLVPVRLCVDLLWTWLAGQDDGLLSLNVWCARVTNHGGAFLAGLRCNAVVGQQLAETLLLWPALVGLHLVGLRHHNQVAFRCSVEELPGAVTVTPPSLCQVGAQLAGQDPERVGWDRNELAMGATYYRQQQILNTYKPNIEAAFWEVKCEGKTIRWLA